MAQGWADEQILNQIALPCHDFLERVLHSVSKMEEVILLALSILPEDAYTDEGWGAQ